MRILGLDWGSIRVGAAVSDPTGKIAFPLEKILEAKTAIEEIKILVTDLGVEKIIIGLPKNLSGQSAASSQKAADFAEKLKSIGIPIEMTDERFTSVEAGKKLTDAGLNQEKQRTIKDNIAAQIMLQQYLEKNN